MAIFHSSFALRCSSAYSTDSMASSVSFLGAFVAPLMIFCTVLSGISEALEIISLVSPRAVFLFLNSSIFIMVPYLSMIKRECCKHIIFEKQPNGNIYTDK